MSVWKDKRVVVLMGGVTHEREISLRTGTAMSGALKRLGYNVTDIDVGHDVVDRLVAARPDVVLIALHGRYGEDGCIQGALEVMRIPYTGTGVLGSAIAMDKVSCKLIARELGLPVAAQEIFDSRTHKAADFANNFKLPLPVIVKPSREGSTIGMAIVRDKKELAGALVNAATSDWKVVVEEFVEGIEVTVGVINGEVLPIIEIAPTSGFYDYKSKYTKGATQYILPARISDALAAKLSQWTLDIYEALECEGSSRADFMVRKDESCAFLEVNTVPGMTETSLIPKAAAHKGISFDEAVERILSGASLKNEKYEA